MRRVLAAVGWVILAMALLFAFNYAMEQDADRLCSNDATAYDECDER